MLISSDLVDIMALLQRKLFKPYPVSGAFVKEKGGRKEPAYFLTEYCKLHLQSPDSIWKSHVVNMLVCPNWHTKIILGLEFLAKNKIVVDAELQMAVTKESGYDLLNPTTPKAPIAPVSAPQQWRAMASAIKLAHREIRTAHVNVHNELLELFNEQLECFNFNAYTSGPPNLIALIKTRIEQLAGEHIL